MKIRIEVVTTVHDRRDLTLGFLQSVFSSDCSGIDLHCIVVDDGSTDGTSEAIREQFPQVEVISGDGNLWYTAGMNLGFRRALEHKPDLILAANDDCVLDANCIQTLVKTARTFPGSIVGAVLVDWDSRTNVFQVAPKWNVWWGGLRHWYEQTIDTIPDRPFKVELIVGNCVLFPADAIRHAGLMDSDRLPQYGDAEYTPRMRKLGWTLLIDPAARAYCKPNDVPYSLRSRSARDAWKALFRDRFGPHSLRRRYHMTMATAPNRLLGYTAFLIHFVRTFFGRSIEKRVEGRREAPLRDIYRTETAENLSEDETQTGNGHNLSTETINV